MLKWWAAEQDTKIKSLVMEVLALDFLPTDVNQAAAIKQFFVSACYHIEGGNDVAIPLDSADRFSLTSTTTRSPTPCGPRETTPSRRSRHRRTMTLRLRSITGVRSLGTTSEASCLHWQSGARGRAAAPRQ